MAVKRLSLEDWINALLGPSEVSSKRNGKWILTGMALLEIAWSMQQQIWNLEERLDGLEEQSPTTPEEK